MSVSHREVPIGSEKFTHAHLADLILQSHDLIKDEHRWTTRFFAQVNGGPLAPGSDPAACTDVRMCAIGAVIVTRWDGALTVMAAGRIDGLDGVCASVVQNRGACGDYPDPLFDRACTYLNDAAVEAGIDPEQSDGWPMIQLNDRLPQDLCDDRDAVRQHLDRVLKVMMAAHARVLRDAQQLTIDEECG